MDFSSEHDCADVYREGFDSDLEAESRLPIAKLQTETTPRPRYWSLFRFYRQEASAQ